MLDDEEEFSADSFSKYRNKRAEEAKQARMLSGDDNDEELRQIIAESKKVQGDSLASTRNALKAVKESEVAGKKTLTKLGQQTDQLNKVEADIEITDKNVETSYKAAKDLHKYDGLIPISFKNMFGGSKKREIDDKLEKDIKGIDKQQSKDLKKMEKREPMGKVDDKKKLAKTGDEVEDEINENLDEISNVVGNLKAIGLSMNDELTVQESQIKRIDATATHADAGIQRTTKKLGKWL